MVISNLHVLEHFLNLLSTRMKIFNERTHFSPYFTYGESSKTSGVVFFTAADQTSLITSLVMQLDTVFNLKRTLELQESH
jgi:hypothetical protein